MPRKIRPLPKKVVLTVSQFLIDLDLHAGDQCPVTIAAAQAGLGRVYTSRTSMWISPGHRTAIQVDLPAHVTDWIDFYDLGRPVSPFQFELTIPVVSD